MLTCQCCVYCRNVVAIKKYQNRTSDRIVGPELTNSSKGGVQVSARYQVNLQIVFLRNASCLALHLEPCMQEVEASRST